jgi:hypothetical protein
VLLLFTRMKNRFSSLALSILWLSPCVIPAIGQVAAKAAEPTAIQLPVFASGDGKGLNAFYRAKNFDASLTADRVLMVQPKDDGKPVGKPFVLRFSCQYAFDQRAVARDLVSLKKIPTPTLQPQKVRVSGEYEENVKFEIDYQFSEDGIVVQGSMDEPSKPKHRSVLHGSASFQPSHAIPAGTPEPEIQKLTEGCVMQLRFAGGEARSVGFWELINSQRDVLSAEVSGPWSQRKVLLESPLPKGKGAYSGTFWNYSGGPLYKGGWAFGRSTTAKSASAPLVVRIK